MIKYVYKEVSGRDLEETAALQALWVSPEQTLQLGALQVRPRSQLHRVRRGSRAIARPSCVNASTLG